MKKILTLILCLIMIATFAACQPKPVNAEVEGTLQELMERIYEKVEVANKPELNTFEIPEGEKAYYIGSDNVEFIDSLVYEPSFSLGGHSIVLIRVAEGTDIEVTKKLIRDNIDPMKWVCTGVGDEDVIVDNIGHLIVLIMSKDSAAYHASFKLLSQPADSSEPPENDIELEGTLQELMEKIYENAELESKPFAPTMPLPTDDRLAYYLGVDNIEFIDGVYSEPMIGSIPHSIVLIRVAEGSNINAIKQLIKNNVNPMKWICVGVGAENVIVDNIGNVIVLIMSKYSAAYHASFKLLAQSGT